MSTLAWIFILLGALALAAAVTAAVLMSRTLKRRRTAETPVAPKQEETALWLPFETTRVIEAPGVQALHALEGQVCSTDQRGVVTVHEKAAPGRRAEIRDDGAVVVEGNVFAPSGWRFHALQWAGDALWGAAKNAEDSGRVFNVTTGEHLEPIGCSSRPQDFFGHSFCVNGEFAIVAHMADCAAHVYRNGAPHAVVTTAAKVSVFPYAVSITPDGAWALLGNPTDSRTAVHEAGSVLRFEWTGAAYEERDAMVSSVAQSFAEFGHRIVTHGEWAVALSSKVDRHIIAHRGTPVDTLLCRDACILAGDREFVRIAVIESDETIAIRESRRLVK